MPVINFIPVINAHASAHVNASVVCVASCSVVGLAVVVIHVVNLNTSATSHCSVLTHVTHYINLTHINTSAAGIGSVVIHVINLNAFNALGIAVTLNTTTNAHAHTFALTMCYVTCLPALVTSSVLVLPSVPVRSRYVSITCRYVLHNLYSMHLLVTGGVCLCLYLCTCIYLSCLFVTINVVLSLGLVRLPRLFSLLLSLYMSMHLSLVWVGSR